MMMHHLLSYHVNFYASTILAILFYFLAIYPDVSIFISINSALWRDKCIYEKRLSEVTWGLLRGTIKCCGIVILRDC